VEDDFIFPIQEQHAELADIVVCENVTDYATLSPLAALVPMSTLLPALSELLVSGGDARIVLNSATGKNKYGCPAQPNPMLAAFGSATATSISVRGLAAAHALHTKIQMRIAQSKVVTEYTALLATIYREEMERIRHALNTYCGVSEQDHVATIFAASGTDLHLITGQLLAGRPTTYANSMRPLRIIMMEESETGSGVATALRGQHFSDCAAQGQRVPEHGNLANANPTEIISIRLRENDGTVRTMATINHEINQVIHESITHGQQVLLIPIDVSKTGLTAPDPAFLACVLQRHREHLTVMVDACQFRLAEASIQAYLKLGCMIALTGSKFVTGPSFSGALLIPAALVPRLSKNTLPTALRDYSVRGDWPTDWPAANQLNDIANIGLLLRWEAALAELRAFRTIPAAQIHQFLCRFSETVQRVIAHSPTLELLPQPVLDRHFLSAEPQSDSAPWDSVQTIFPILLRHADAPGLHLSREQTHQLYLQLQTSPQQVYQLGQPVLCGVRHGVAVSALRICASARLIVEACENGENSAQRVLQRVVQCITKINALVTTGLSLTESNP